MADEPRPPARPAEALRSHPPAPRPPAWHRSEQPVMTDGQLGSDCLDQGPEGHNPEGTSDLSRPVDRPFGGSGS